MEGNELSPWGAAATEYLLKSSADIYFKEQLDYSYKLSLIEGSLWLTINHKKAENMLSLRTVFSLVSDLQVNSIKEEEGELSVNLNSAVGDYVLKLYFPDDHFPIVHYTVPLKPNVSLQIPFWPKDILVRGNVNPRKVKGKVHISQFGTRTGLIYADIKDSVSSFLYLQNLTALNSYFQETETSAADTVGGNFPEMGFSLPPTTDKFLQANKEYIIADTFLALEKKSPKNQFDIAISFINLLSQIYLHLQKPETKYHDYPNIVKNAINDLNTKGCWNYINGKSYLNAYLSDYNTPPEIMVQLAVLLPVYDYLKWSGDKSMQISTDLKTNLSSFYNPDLKTVVRWLPAAEDMLDESEEQKVPGVIDSWYLHHPLLNLSRLALNGDKIAKELYLNSLQYAIKVARHFKYQWPVFYKMDSLEVVKEETKEGEGGEKDVAGIYAHVMLQAYELTKDKKYLREAETAAKTLTKYGFDIFYQANNTAFSASAMLRLWKITRKEIYLKLSYLIIANLFKNMALWSCEYGYGKNFPTFFSIFPLNDAPYIAVYEEHEVMSAIHDYLKHAEGEDILPSFSLLLAEYIKYAIGRVVYYYPPMLPEDMLEEEIKTGELNPKLWIPLEDIRDGWEKSGGVGQEVYGAGLSFSIVPRHYIKVKNQDFMIYLDYPFAKPQQRKNTISLTVFGNEQLRFRLMIIKKEGKALPKITVSGSRDKTPEMLKDTNGNLEFNLSGNQKIRISW